MDNIEYSILSEVCSVNYSELLTNLYETYYKKRTHQQIIPFLGLLSTEKKETEERKRKYRRTTNDPFGVAFNHRVLAVLTDFDFKYHFKVSKTTVEIIIQLFERLQTTKKWVGRPTIELSRSVLIGLWYLISNEPYRLLCDRFSTAIGHSNHTVRTFLQTISSLKKEFISWPKKNELTFIEEEFEHVTDKSMLGVVGCIDSCQIKTRRNKFRVLGFVVMQLVCDAKMRIIDEWSGEASQLYDSAMFNQSTLSLRMRGGSSLMGDGQHILGDSRFPLLPNLMTPYPQEDLDQTQLHFNNVLSVYRQIVIDTMRALFGRFTRLSFLDLFKTGEIANAITTCCVIHNICLSNNDPLPLLPEESVLGPKGITDVDAEDERAEMKRSLIAAQMMSMEC